VQGVVGSNPTVPTMLFKRIVFFLFLFISSISFAQSVNVGVRAESLTYFFKNVINNTGHEYFLPIPLSGYLKAGVSYDKYELELKGGGQLGEVFAGPEYALELKYNIIKNIYPLVVYLNHINSGNSHNSGGTYSNTIEFMGIGIEAKLIKLFAMDLIYYVPVGNSDLEYSIDYSSDNSVKGIASTKMTSMIKLGFIISFNLF
jgi:hypothetical protein